MSRVTGRNNRDGKRRWIEGMEIRDGEGRISRT